MTTLLVIANVLFAAGILAGLAAVVRLGHWLGSGHHDHRILSLSQHRRVLEPQLEREAA
jgi:hypothetical protein